MIYKLSINSGLLKRLPLLLKNCKEIHINISTITCGSIILKLNNFSNFSCKMATKDFVELVSNTDVVDLSDEVLKYNYVKNINGIQIQVNKEIKVLENKISVDLPTPKLNIQISKFKIINEAKINLKVKNNLLILSSNDRIKTRILQKVKIYNSSEKQENCFINGKSLEIIKQLNENITISFFDNFISINEIDDDHTISIFINKIFI